MRSALPPRALHTPTRTANPNDLHPAAPAPARADRPRNRYAENFGQVAERLLGVLAIMHHDMPRSMRAEAEYQRIEAALLDAMPSADVLTHYWGPGLLKRITDARRDLLARRAMAEQPPAEGA